MSARAAKTTTTGAQPRPLLTPGMASILYFALALVYFLPAFLPERQIYGSDYLTGALFVHEFISARFAAGALPKWIPEIYGGLPLFANPGSAYYPFRFLIDFFLPISKLWPSFFVIQFGLAGIGTYLLARELRVRAWVSFVAGLAFEFTGLTMSWVLAGQEGRIMVATLAPLVFYLFRYGIRSGAFAAFVGASATLGFALLSFQIQTAYYLLVAAALWSAFVIWDLEIHRDRRKLVRVIVLGLAAVAFAFLMASVNFLPFQDYIASSNRGIEGGRGYEYATSYSMPIPEISAIAVPELFGFLDHYTGSNPIKLHTEYVGAFAIILAALGFLYARRRRYFWFFVGLGLFTLTIAFGGNTPIYRIYYELLPGTDKFRAPAISFFLFSLSVVMMAALALDALAGILEEQAGNWRASRRDRADAGPSLSAATRVMAVVVVASFLLGVMASKNAGPIAFRFALFAAAMSLVLWLWLNDRLGRTAFVLLLSLLTVADLWVMDRNFFRTVPAPDQIFAADDVVSFLKTQPGRDRVWVLPFPTGGTYRGQSGDYLMRFDIDQAGGEHSDPLQSWNEYLGVNDQNLVDWHNFLQHRSFLDAANVRYLISGVPLQDDALTEVHRGPGGVVLENESALGRAYLVPSVVTGTPPDSELAVMGRAEFDPRQEAIVRSDTAITLPDTPLTGSAQIASYEPDRVTINVQASRPALLVLADNYYHGWRAEMDGRDLPILRTNHTMRGVVVPAGNGVVTFSYHPPKLYEGFAIYLACIGLLLLYGLYFIARVVRERRGAAQA